MRFQLTLIFSALNVSSTFARMNHASTRTHDHPSIARRQHQHQPLLLGDTCVQVKASVLINSMVEVVDSLNLLDTNTGLDLFAKADVCLCLSAVSLFVQTDIRLRAMVDLVGEDKTELMLRTLIENSGSTCHSPPHAVFKPVRANDCDPCEFTCERTFEKRGNQCVCPSPKMECRGRCADSCPSATTQRRDEAEQHIQVEISEISTYDQALGTCDPFDTVCGTRSQHRDYDCCDILNNKKNCGGCTIDHPFGEHLPRRGRDCDSMDHRKTTWCDAGECRVEDCEKGWRPNADFTACVEVALDFNLDVDL